MTDRVVHFEIPFSDGERARDFYAAAFDWSLEPVPGGTYIHADTGPSTDYEPNEPGFINGGLLRREGPDQGPIVVIEVDDIDASLARIEELGGQIVLAKQQAGATGSAAYFKDVEGNIMGLWQRA